MENIGSNGERQNDTSFTYAEKYAWSRLQTMPCIDPLGKKFKKLIALYQKECYGLQKPTFLNIWRNV